MKQYINETKEYQLHKIAMKEPRSDASASDIFMHLLSLDTLGFEDKFSEGFKRWEGQLRSSGLYDTLLSNSWSVRQENSDLGIERLITSLDKLSNNIFAKAYTYYGFALTFARMNRPQLTCRLYKKSAELFLQQNFLYQSWLCLYGRCYSLFLRYPNQRLRQQNILKGLIEHPWAKTNMGRAHIMVGFLALTQGHVETSKKHYIHGLELLDSESEKACVLADLAIVCNLGLGGDSKELMKKIEAQWKSLENPAKRSTELMKHLVLLSKNQVNSAATLNYHFDLWKGSDASALFKRQLIECLMQQIFLSKQWPLLELACHRLSEVPEVMHTEMEILDIRFYQAIVAWQQKDWESWFYLTKLIDEKRQGYISLENRQYLRDLPFSNERSNGSISLDLSQHSMQIGNERPICLLKFPLIERFFKILTQHPDGLEMPILFEKIYGQSYLPDLNKKRLESLIGRSRQIVGNREVILRRNERVSLHTHVKVEILASSSKATRMSKVENRRKKILTFLNTSSDSSTIQEISSALNLPRRTAQMDLRLLTQSGVVKKIGSARSTRYTLN